MKLVSTIFLLLLSGSLYAQEIDTAVAPSTPAAPEPTVAELAAEVESLKSKVTTWDKIRKALKVSGYLQTGYEWSNTSSNFFIKRARVAFTGNITPKLDYKVQIEICSPTFLGEAYLRYRPFTQLCAQIGEFKIPFSIENPDYAPYAYEFIEYPMVLRKLVAMNDVCGLASTGRDMGGMLSGGFFKRKGYSILNYNLAVFNGEGINTKDQNKSKDLVAKLTLRPIEGLQIAGSYYWGEYGKEYLKRVRYGIGACYDLGAFVARSEYVYGITGASEEGTITNFDSDGWYAMGGWRPSAKWMIMGRYENFRANVDLYATTQNNYTAGVLYSPVKYLRCQLNYTYENPVAESLKCRNVIAVMFTGIF